MEDVQLIFGDCLLVMGDIPDRSIDLVCADLPFGSTSCAWDVVIPLEPLWDHYRRLLKSRGAVVLMAIQPFSSVLVMSNPGWFKYAMVWDKKMCSGIYAAKFRPLQAHLDLLVFGPAKTIYNPQMIMRAEDELKRLSHRTKVGRSRSDHAPHLKTWNANRNENKFKNPSTLVRIPAVVNNSSEKVGHPSQKPVALMEYLIRTYSNEGDTVLDNAMGSATTGVACIYTGRRFIGIEKVSEYFSIAERRIALARAKTPLFPA